MTPINEGLQMVWDDFVAHCHRSNVPASTLWDDYNALRGAELAASACGQSYRIGTHAISKLVLDAWIERNCQ